MGTESQIVDLGRGEDPGGMNGEQPATADPGPSGSLPDWLDAQVDLPADAAPRQPLWRRWLPALLLLAAACWTGLFLWSLLPALPRDPRAIADAIGSWALPVVLLLSVWLLALRTSTAEALRFADAGARLTREVEGAEERLKRMTGEIALARSLVDGEARRLETLGRTASAQLVESAASLVEALRSSEQAAGVLDTLTGNAGRNLAALREELPVAANATRDVVNQIGAAGRAAQAQVATLQDAIEGAGRAGATLRETVGDIEARTAASAERIQARTGEMQRAIGDTLDGADRRSRQLVEDSGNLIDGIAGRLEDAALRQQAEIARQGNALATLLAELDTALARFAGVNEERGRQLGATLERIAAQEEASAARVAALENESVTRQAELAGAISILSGEAETMAARLSAAREEAGSLSDRVGMIVAELCHQQQAIEERIGPDFDALFERADRARTQLAALAGDLEATAAQDRELAVNVERTAALVAGEAEAVRGAIEASRTALAERHDQSDALSLAVARARADVDALAGEAQERLAPALLRVRETAGQAIESSRRALDTALDETLVGFRERLDAALAEEAARVAVTLDAQITGRVSESEARIEAMVADAAERIGALDTAVLNLAARIADAEDQLPRGSEASFARQMALLIESLNSAAIDVAKLLSTDVTDTAWAAYLKGDRGVFTRRAVRLLSNSEARVVAHSYEQDAEFREQVNRYVHDFEAMIRGLLSTRDGSALSVTLLSSDVGKLYVALAQAIERLRS